jgi:hypothetical protein
MSCFWNKEGTCRHPRIGNTPAFPERCGSCAMQRIVPLNIRPIEEKASRFQEAKREERRQAVAELKPKVPGIVSKALSWAKAEISKVVKGPVADDEYRDRLEICNGCPKLQRSSEEGKLGWCTACGCGTKGRAELTIKATMPEAKCPIQAWGSLSAKRVPLPQKPG